MIINSSNFSLQKWESTGKDSKSTFDSIGNIIKELTYKNFDKDFQQSLLNVLSNFSLPNEVDLWKSYSKKDSYHISSLREALENDEIVSKLRDTRTPRHEREKMLRKWIKDCFIAICREYPPISSVANGTIASRISSARVSDEENCYSDLLFGLFCSRLDSSSLFFGTIFHELMHNVLRYGFEFDWYRFDGYTKFKSLEAQSIHETICDLAMFAMYSKIAGADESLSLRFNRWLKRDERNLEYERCFNAVCGSADEEHKAARAFLYNIICEARRNNLDLQELMPMLFEASISVIEEHKKHGTQNELDFFDFIQELIEKVNERLRNKGVEIVEITTKKEDIASLLTHLADIKTRKNPFPNYSSLNDLKNQIFINQILPGIAVPRISIIRTGNTNSKILFIPASVELSANSLVSV